MIVDVPTNRLMRMTYFIEQLRHETIGEPNWLADKIAYEYDEHSAGVVAILKLVRAGHGVNALNLLCRVGFFIDFGAIVRCVGDCVDEVYFLMEEYPEASGNVQKFVRNFFEATIDGYLDAKTQPIEKKKIIAARVRYLKGGPDNDTHELMQRLYKTFCGYIHADYSHIMEAYNGGTCSFNLEGIPSVAERQKRLEFVTLNISSVSHAAALVAEKMNRDVLRKEFLAVARG
jgi:hypothetical protein